MALMAAPALAADVTIDVDGTRSTDITSSAGDNTAITGTNSANIPSLIVGGGNATVDGTLTVNNGSIVTKNGSLTVLGTMNVSYAVCMTSTSTLRDGGTVNVDGTLNADSIGIYRASALHIRSGGALTAKKLTVEDGYLEISGTATASEALSLTDAELYLYNDATIATANLSMNGGSFVGISGALTVSDTATLSGGALAVANGGYFIFGTDDAEWAQTAMNTMAPGSSAAVTTLGLYKPLTLSGTSLAVDNAYPSKYGGSTLYLGDKAALVINVGGLSGAPALTAPDGSVFKAEDDISIYLANTPGSGSYTLLSGFTGGIVIDGETVGATL